MRTFINYGLRISILLYTFLHIITAFIEEFSLIQLLFFVGLTIILFTILSIPPLKLKLSILVFLTSIIILIFSGSNLIIGFFSVCKQMRNIIGLLVVIPLISWILQEEPYIENMIIIFHRFIDTSKKFYFVLVSLTQILAFFYYSEQSR